MTSIRKQELAWVGITKSRIQLCEGENAFSASATGVDEPRAAKASACSEGCSRT